LRIRRRNQQHYFTEVTAAKQQLLPDVLVLGQLYAKSETGKPLSGSWEKAECWHHMGKKRSITKGQA